MNTVAETDDANIATTSLMIWVTSLAGGIAILVLLAALREVELHAFVGVLIALIAAATGLRDVRAAEAAGASVMELAATSTRHSAVLWGWIALVVTVTYGTGIEIWSGWWQFALAFFAVAVLCLAIANLLVGPQANDADSNLRKLAWFFSFAQFVAAIAVMAGIIISGRSAGISQVLGLGDGAGLPASWAADNIFFFATLALVAVSGDAMRVLITKTGRNG